MDFKKYWTEDKGRNITAGHHSNPEGFDVPEFLRHLLGYVEKDIGKSPKVHDLGCGTGRLCSVASPDRYVGSDLSPGSIEKARELNPEYTFQEVNVSSLYPDADVTLAYTVFLHMDDEVLDKVLLNISMAGHEYICVAEILGREWRRKGNPPVFNRDLTDYVAMLRKHGYYLFAASDKVYQHYKSHAPKRNCRLFGLLFRKEGH